MDISNTAYYRYAIENAAPNSPVCEYVRLACQRFLNDLKRPELMFRPEKVERVIKFMGSLRHFKGKAAGKKFILEPWQQFIVANLYGFYRMGEDGRPVRRFTQAYIEMGRKNGKGFSLDTPIPVPGGWTTMGELKEGDTIYGADGRPCTVTYATEVMYDHDCYRIEFADGDSVIADGDHNWFVKDRHPRRPVNHVLTTREMFNRGISEYGHYVFAIPSPDPATGVEKDLLMDPYTLGAWLGNGRKNASTIAVNTNDIEIAEFVASVYGDYHTRILKNTDNCVECCFRGEMSQKLRKLNLIDNKHIPVEYFTASYEQRLALIQGLMDTDGNIYKYSKCNCCTFVQKSDAIANGLCELLSSVGIRYRHFIRKTRSKGKEYGTHHVITFYTDRTVPVFRLHRKYDMLPEHTADKQRWTSITSITPVESVPVRCITVDGPDNLYLFGKRYKVTHNTALAAGLALYHLMYDHEHGAECILAATSREQAGICYELCTGFAKSVDRVGKYLHIIQKGIEFKKTMSKLKVISADASKNDGFSASFAVVDEYHAHRNSKLYDVIKSSMGFRRQPLLMTITTAGFDRSLPCYEMRRTNIEILQGMKQDDARFCIIYTLDEGDDWTDEKNWHKCSPNLGVTISTGYIRDQVTSAMNSPSEEVGVLTKNMNIWTDTSEVWIPSKYIEEFTPGWFQFDFEDFRDQACWIGVDLASTSDLTGVAVMFVDEENRKFVYKTQAFLPEEAMKTSPNRDQYREYVRTGDIILTPGNVTDYDYITQYILNLVITFGLVIQGIFYDRWNATFWAIKATQEGLPLIPFGQGLMNFSGPTKEFERLTLSGCILCASSALMRWCFRNVVLMRDHNENIKPSKNGRNQKIDLTICMIEALGGYMSQTGMLPEIFGLNTTDGKNN